MADEIVKNDQTGGQSGAGASGAPKQPTDEEVRAQKLKADNDALTAKNAEISAANKLATEELQRVREEKRTAKKEVKAQAAPAPAPEVPKEVVIDESAPEAQAWLKRISQSVSPVTEELEKEKSEIRSFAISKFLEGKPSLARNPEKLKELMQVYDRSHTASERTVEGVLIDLEKSYAYTHSSELFDAARQGRVDDAKRNAIFSDIGVSRGSTGYAAPQETAKENTEEEKAILARWSQSAAFPKDIK